MHCPTHGDRRRQTVRLRPEAVAQSLPLQCATHNPKEDQRRGCMDHQVEHMITPRVQPADRIIQRKRQNDYRPTCPGSTPRRLYYIPQRPEMSYVRVYLDPQPIIENEWP